MQEIWQPRIQPCGLSTARMHVSRGRWRSSPLKTKYTCLTSHFWLSLCFRFFFFSNLRGRLWKRNLRPAATPIQALRVSARKRECRGVPAESEHCAGTVSETQIMSTERQDNHHPSRCSQALPSPSPAIRQPPTPTPQEEAIKPQHASLFILITPEVPPIQSDACNAFVCTVSINILSLQWAAAEPTGSIDSATHAGL